MAETKHLVILTIEDIIENGEIIGKKVSDADGNSLKVKKGQGGSLKDRWDTLIVGKAYKFSMGEFKGFPFVQDFVEVSSDALEPQKTPPKGRAGSNPPEPQDRQSSIETQNSNTAVGNWLCASIAHPESPLAMKPDSPFFQAFKSYNSSKMAKDFSQGEVEEVETTAGKEVPEKTASPEQIKKLTAVAKKEGYTPALAVAIMNRLWHKATSKALTIKEADEFIKIMEQGLHKAGEPEDIPF